MGFSLQLNSIPLFIYTPHFQLKDNEFIFRVVLPLQLTQSRNLQSFVSQVIVDSIKLTVLTIAGCSVKEGLLWRMMGRSDHVY